VNAGIERPFLFMQEYVPSIPLTAMSELRADRFLNASYPDSSNRLINMGKIIAADIFLNNLDRYYQIFTLKGFPLFGKMMETSTISSLR
jgi:hypothetical protein